LVHSFHIDSPNHPSHHLHLDRHIQHDHLVPLTHLVQPDHPSHPVLQGNERSANSQLAVERKKTRGL
jgi:hypothetical protein